jgi:hypothetical protein
MNARFQNKVNNNARGIPQYLAGDMLGNKNLMNPSQSAIVNRASASPQGIATFTWMVDNQTCTPLKADSNNTILGFVARSQDTTWTNANTNQGWSMQVGQGYQLQYFVDGTFSAVCPSLNNGGAGPIVYGDLVLINNTTGALVSQTSSTIPAGYSQVVTGNKAWKVINTTTVSDAEGNLIDNLVAISNIQATI